MDGLAARAEIVIGSGKAFAVTTDAMVLEFAEGRALTDLEDLIAQRQSLGRIILAVLRSNGLHSLSENEPTETRPGKHR